MRRVLRVLERRGRILVVAIAGLTAACQTAPAPAAERSARTGYDALYEHGDRPQVRPRAEQRAPSARYTRVAARIESSVYGAAADSGIPADIIAELVRIFSDRVAFARDVQPGDELDVTFEQPPNSTGILAASMTLSGKTQTLYRFESGGRIEYFDAEGRSAAAMLMRSPIEGAEISSGFGRRSRNVHDGIDFRTPPGTPVRAAGIGEVTFAGHSRGYGNLLVIGHGDGYSTAYAHLSRFAPGLREGASVRQGEVIAYSGATGNATGPHLHYEIRLNGKAVDPATVNGAFGRTLSGDEHRRFLAERARIDELAASLPVQARVAQWSQPRGPQGRS